MPQYVSTCKRTKIEQNVLPCHHLTRRPRYLPPSALQFRIQLGGQEENGVAEATTIQAPAKKRDQLAGSCKKKGPVSQRLIEERVPSSAGLSELGTKRYWEEVLLSSICARRLNTKTGKRFAEFRIMYNTDIESVQKTDSDKELPKLFLNDTLTLMALVAATSSSLGMETVFKGASLDLPNKKLQNIVPFEAITLSKKPCCTQLTRHRRNGGVEFETKY